MPTSRSQQDIDKAETLAKNIRRTEREVSRHTLDADKQEKTDWLSCPITQNLCSHSKSPKCFKLRHVDERSLILIATRDDDEFNALWEPFKVAIGDQGYTAVALRMKLKDTPELSGQTYGLEAAMEKCSIQIKNMLSENEESIEYYAKTYNVHSVHVGAITSYIELQSRVNGRCRLVEYNVAVYSNALNPITSDTASSISNGVTVPTRFFGTKGSFENFRHREYKDLDWYNVVLDNGTTRGKILLDCTMVLLNSHSNTLFRFYAKNLWDKFSATKQSEIYAAHGGGRPILIKSTEDEVDSDTSKSATSKSATSKSATSNSATSNSTTTRSEISKAAAPNPQKPTPKTTNSATSTPVKPELVTHRSDRSKSAPSKADESTSDTSQLLKRRSDRPKTATTKLDKLHKLDPRKLKSRQHKGYKQLEEY